MSNFGVSAILDHLECHVIAENPWCFFISLNFTKLLSDFGMISTSYSHLYQSCKELDLFLAHWGSSPRLVDHWSRMSRTILKEVEFGGL